MKTRLFLAIVVCACLALLWAGIVAAQGEWLQSGDVGFGDPSNIGITTLASFGGQLYAGTSNSVGTAQLWRSGEGVVWEPVLTDGFGVSSNVGIDHLFSFGGRLYAGTWGDEVNGGEVYRSSDGVNWTRVVSRGFGNPTNAEIFRFAAFNNRLYAGTMSYTETHGCEIWRSSTGNSGSWTRVVTNGFGDVNNAALASFETFNGYLYAGTMNFVTGGEVWRSVSGGQADWAQVNTDGFGDASNWGVTALAAFGSHLYAATGRSGAGAQLWRCQICDGSDWQNVVDNGFDNPNARGSPALEVFAGQLYFVVGNTVTGMEVWRSQDGTNWEQVGFEGFGNSHNRSTYYDNSVGVFNGRLFVGTVNWSGGELWSYPNYRVFLPVIVRH